MFRDGRIRLECRADIRVEGFQVHDCGSVEDLLRVNELKGKCQGRVHELVPRDSFNVIQGCANSRSGRLGIPEVTWMDGLGFSLCAAPLEIVESVANVNV